MKDLMGLMKQAQAMQQKMADAQAKLDEEVVTGEAGAGMISVSMTAKGDLKGVNIDKSLIDPEEPEILEDLILAAHNDARRKAEQRQQEILKDAAGGLELPPGMQMPF
ncbi:MAG: YbaB/EbfC family nucleoid-associated protein [Alphaproteobacteria bacterium]|uniref:YbaB/EbfC family nucleoid-associated protein n=1 Tax=Maricaulis alexandrii TaxID=2570354 RepID=UPI001108D20C|nr:YbaB/EbfC family nucleoid-associated protein [Maricaulis alexandrii]MCR9266422.1 YbaB/EbfC family nucleoid-associated protein [Alphaproteobacteria bacterium]